MYYTCIFNFNQYTIGWDESLSALNGLLWGEVLSHKRSLSSPRDFLWLPEVSHNQHHDVPESIFPVSFCTLKRLDLGCEKLPGSIEGLWQAP